MGKRSRAKKEKKLFKAKLINYETRYLKELRRLLSQSSFDEIPLILKTTRSIIYECNDGYAILRFPRQTLPDIVEFFKSDKTVGETINQFKFKSHLGEEANIKIFPDPLNGMVATIAIPIVKEGTKVFYPDYHTVLVYGRYLVGDPLKSADIDFQTFLIGRNLGVSPDLKEYKFSVEEALIRLANNFEEVLNKSLREEEIQRFIDDHPMVFSPTMVRHIPKMQIGKYITDFVFVEKNGWYQFIELERSDSALFTKKSDFTIAVTHGWQQLEDWDRELETKKEKIQKKFNIENIENRKFTLVIGRSKDLDPEKLQKIKTKSRGSNKYEIITYDEILQSIKMLISNIRKIK